MPRRARTGDIVRSGEFVTIKGERIKVGKLHGPGNARRERGELRGIFAIVQWFHRGEPLEKIAYNVAAVTTGGARTEMGCWMKRLQYPEFRESSKLLAIVEHREPVS